MLSEPVALAARPGRRTRAQFMGTTPATASGQSGHVRGRLVSSGALGAPLATRAATASERETGSGADRASSARRRAGSPQRRRTARRPRRPRTQRAPACGHGTRARSDRGRGPERKSAPRCGGGTGPGRRPAGTGRELRRGRAARRPDRIRCGTMAMCSNVSSCTTAMSEAMPLASTRSPTCLRRPPGPELEPVPKAGSAKHPPAHSARSVGFPAFRAPIRSCVQDRAGASCLRA